MLCRHHSFCWWCGAAVTYENSAISWLVPRTLGVSARESENVALACVTCGAVIGDRPVTELAVSIDRGDGILSDEQMIRLREQNRQPPPPDDPPPIWFELAGVKVLSLQRQFVRPPERPDNETPTVKDRKKFKRRCLEKDPHCFYCGRFLWACAATIEHIVPTAAGGADDPSNWVVACACCNLVRRAHSLIGVQISINRGDGMLPICRGQQQLIDPATWEGVLNPQPPDHLSGGLAPSVACGTATET